MKKMVGAAENDDFFDFSEQILGKQAKDQKVVKNLLTQENEVQTSYLLVNALLSLLVKKGIIYPHEVQAYVAELHADYVKKKRGHS